MFDSVVVIHAFAHAKLVADAAVEGHKDDVCFGGNLSAPRMREKRLVQPDVRCVLRNLHTEALRARVPVNAVLAGAALACIAVAMRNRVVPRPLPTRLLIAMEQVARERLRHGEHEHSDG